MNVLLFTFKYLDSMITLAIGIVVVIALVIVGTIFLKKKDEKTKLLPIKICFFALIIMEVAKIYYLISVDGSFNPNRYPIVFCSIVMYTYPLFCFKKNKLSDFAMGMSVLPCLISIIFVFLTVGDNALMRPVGFSIIHFHSIIYHLVMFGVSLYLITSSLYKFEFKKSVSVGIGLTGYVFMATVISLFIKGDISFFGPGFNGSAVLGIVYDKVGYASGNVLIIIAMWLLTFSVYGIIEGFKRLHIRRQNRKLEVKENA